MFIMKFYKVYTEIFKSIFVFFIKEKIFKSFVELLILSHLTVYICATVRKSYKASAGYLDIYAYINVCVCVVMRERAVVRIAGQ